MRTKFSSEVAVQPPNGLVLERLPNGEYAWLRPARRYVLPARYWLTQRSRDLCARWRAQRSLFAQPWPTVAEVAAGHTPGNPRD